MSASRPDHGVEYWDGLAKSFDEDVCHVLGEDRGRVLAQALKAEARRAGRHALAGDFGCGTGRALPLLLRHFERVLAVDGSAGCLQIAREAVRESGRVEFRRADLGASDLRLPRVDVGLCINVALTPEEKPRERILRNVARAVKPGGRLLLVVPALESELLVRQRWKAWAGEEWSSPRGERLDRGLVHVGGTLTKTWTREELLLLAPTLRCRAISIERVEYGWHTEFDRPPRSMREPYPWDWLVALERVSSARGTRRTG